MKEIPHILDFNEEDKSMVNLKEELVKYVRYWPWFLISIVLFMALGYAYMWYTPMTYKSVAKIKILDNTKELKVLQNTTSYVDPNARVNLKNHMEALKSYRLLSHVVSDLKLDVSYHKLGNINYTQIWNPPFVVTKNVSEDHLPKPLQYELTFSTTGFNIKGKDGKIYISPYDKSSTPLGDLPFNIELNENSDIKDYEDTKYKVVLDQVKKTTLALTEKLDIKSSETESDILTMSLSGESKERSESILNEIIKKFDQDDILDKQLASKRTIEVIDKRFIYLSGELDSIEVGKQNFKQANNLSNIEVDAGMSLQRKSETEAEVFKLETQISLSRLLKETVANEADYRMLPADIGLSNNSLNDLVTNYNVVVAEREKLITLVGPNHPRLLALSKQLEQGKLNILNTVNVYESQLGVSMEQLDQQRNRANYRFSRIPQKEKRLRSIERQQSIKENLFLLLLQKREEAAIDHAATVSSVKIIDYALTSIKPTWPRKIILYPIAMMLGTIFPFMIFFIKFALDTKIHSRSDIEKLNLEVPVVSEIPYFEEDKKFIDANDRSILAESFRILSTNVNYLLPKKEDAQGQVVFVTSAIKGEGKTLVALNLSLAYASMQKKVLLVGADLRNPQLQTYFDCDDSTVGLSDYLNDPKIEFEDGLQEGFGENRYHKTYLAGVIPNNAPVFLSNKRFDRFMEIAKQKFDYVIVDTAPTMLVTDTLLISYCADVTLFTVRSGYTDQDVMAFSNDLSRSKRIGNMAYVLNAIGQGNGNNYNYGYGYGYELDKPSEPWYKKYLKKKKAPKTKPNLKEAKA